MWALEPWDCEGRAAVLPLERARERLGVGNSGSAGLTLPGPEGGLGLEKPVMWRTESRARGTVCVHLLPTPTQIHTWKEVREASQSWLPECLSSSGELNSKGLLVRTPLVSFVTGRKHLSLLKSFCMSCQLGAARDRGCNWEG